MKHYFGPNYSFEATAPSAPGVQRFYQNVDAYIEEGALARILGAMHFRTSIDEGTRQGKRVGNWIKSLCFTQGLHGRAPVVSCQLVPGRVAPQAVRASRTTGSPKNSRASYRLCARHRS